MFELLGVTLLQPEALIASRLPGGAEALGAFVQSIKVVLENAYADRNESAALTLVVAIGPTGRLGFWLSSADDVTLEAEEAPLALLRAIAAPEVVEGPVVFALVFRIGAEAIAEAQLTLPEAWQAVVRASDTTLTPDQIIVRLWSGV